MADSNFNFNFNFPTGFPTFPFDLPSSSSTHLPIPPKNTMDSSRILSPNTTTTTTDDNQDHKRRCFEKLLVEVIDDTALIEATAAVSGFKKNHHSFKKNPIGNGFKSFKAAPIVVGSKKVVNSNNKQENDGRKKRNYKGSTKKVVPGRCSTKCANESKVNNGQSFEGQSGQRGGGGANEKKKKVLEGKGGGPKMLRKMYGGGGGKVKAVYQRKDTTKLVVNATDLENHNVPIKNVSNGVFPEPEMVISKASNGVEFEKESTLELVETEAVNEKDDGLTPKADIHTEESEENDQEAIENSTVGSKKMAEIKALRFVNEKDDGFTPKTDIHTVKIEENDQEVRGNPTVGSKKIAFSVEEIEALRFVDEKDDGFTPKTDIQTEKIEEKDQEIVENPTVGSKKMAYSREAIEALRFVDEKDNGLTPKTEKIEENNQEVRENPTVGLKKMAYSREAIEALRFVGEGLQIEKWGEVFSALSPSVAREYTGLLVETDNRQSQRYTRVANCGSSRNAILRMPPVLPLCSSSNDRKFTPYGRGFRVNFH